MKRGHTHSTGKTTSESGETPRNAKMHNEKKHTMLYSKQMMHMYEYEYADKKVTQMKQRMNKHHNSTGYSARLNQMDISSEILLEIKLENPAGDKQQVIKGIKSCYKAQISRERKILLGRNPQINLLKSIIMNST